MNRLRALAAHLRRPQPLDLDSQLDAFEAIWRHPATRRRNTPRRGNR